jgi:hypothetical protein
MFEEQDVFVVMDGEEVASPGHPFVILAVINHTHFLYSNITDCEHESDLACIICPEDDPFHIEKKSTFRYQNIEERPIEKLASALKARKIKCTGKLSSTAFKKIIEGAKTSELIKPKYRDVLLAIHGDAREI